MITQAELKKLFEYRDGNLYVIEPRRKAKVGSLVGSPSKQGYLRTMINYKFYYVHRLIFLYHHGYMPEMLDHIDGNPSNNKIENLRPCTKQENGLNRGKPKHNTSGVKGVSLHKATNKWLAQAREEGKVVYLGLFDTIDKAEDRMRQYREVYHGQFANHGT